MLTKTVRLHHRQLEFRQSPALYRGFVGGRGAGKSWIGAYDLIRRAKPGRTYLIASPTGVKLQDETYPTFKRIAQDLGVWKSVKLTPYPNVTLHNGATVRFRSAEDPEKLRGPNLSGVWLDEASLMEEDAYTIVIACLREAGEQGWLSATFTPKGKTHWTYALFGADPPKPNTALFRAATGDNPFNPPEFQKTLAEQYSPMFARQELDGLFLNMEGAEFPGEWFPESVFFDRWPSRIIQRVVCLDPSMGGEPKEVKQGDYQAFVLLCRDSDGGLWVDADLGRRNITQIAEHAFYLAKFWERETGGLLDALGVEDNLFQALLLPEFIRVSQELGGIMLPVKGITNPGRKGGGNKKESRIRRLTPYLKNFKLRFKNNSGTRLLVRQLQEFPICDHDDGPDALEMAMRILIILLDGGGK